MGNNDKDEEMFDDDARFVLTPHCILYDLLSSMFDVGDWNPDLWEALFGLLMKRLEKAGYIAKRDEGEEE